MIGDSGERALRYSASMRAPGASRQLLAFLLLPFNVIIVVPGALLWFGRAVDTRWRIGYPLLAAPQALGLVGVVGGLFLVAWSVRLFVTIGRGTLAPWDPTRRLVVDGPYRYVRNPMISGVLLVLLGAAAVSGSMLVLGWAALFFVINHTHFLAWEEPGLARRFGDEYVAYRNGVPRWIPRRTPWQRPAPARPDPRP